MGRSSITMHLKENVSAEHARIKHGESRIAIFQKLGVVPKRSLLAEYGSFQQLENNCDIVHRKPPTRRASRINRELKEPARGESHRPEAKRVAASFPADRLCKVASTAARHTYHYCRPRCTVEQRVKSEEAALLSSGSGPPAALSDHARALSEQLSTAISAYPRPLSRTGRPRRRWLRRHRWRLQSCHP